MCAVKEKINDFNPFNLEKKSKSMNLINELTLNVKLYKIEETYILIFVKNSLHFSETEVKTTKDIMNIPNIIHKSTLRDLNYVELNQIKDFDFNLYINN